MTSFVAVDNCRVDIKEVLSAFVVDGEVIRDAGRFDVQYFEHHCGYSNSDAMAAIEALSACKLCTIIGKCGLIKLTPLGLIAAKEVAVYLDTGIMPIEPGGYFAGIPF